MPSPITGESEVNTVIVGPELKDCVGVAPMKCMVVNGELFYDEIEGFTYEEGYDYYLVIQRFDPWGGKEPPQDASRYGYRHGYRLVSVMSKTRAELPATVTPTVTPTNHVVGSPLPEALLVMQAEVTGWSE